jgi:CheY-like chemotaxis protein
VEAPPAKVPAPATIAPPAISPRKEPPPPRGEGLREDQWLYLLSGNQSGPVDIEELIDLVLTSIPEDTRVWHPGLKGWMRARDVPAIAEEIPPPLPGTRDASFLAEDMPDFDTVPQQFRVALVADEDEGFRRHLAMPLAAQGFTVLEAADGSAAWQLAVQNRPWLILADISMPEIDGFEFCGRVRNHPLLSHTPLLFISNSDRYKERYRALQLGADDFLSKQMPIRELLMRIQLLLTRYSDLAAHEQQGGAKADEAGAFQGRVEVFGTPALLQMCAQGQLSGALAAFAEDQDHTTASMDFRRGEIISARVGSLTGIDAAVSFLTWRAGTFRFTPGDPGPGEPLARSVDHLLLESSRLLDEARAGKRAFPGKGSP